VGQAGEDARFKLAQQLAGSDRFRHVVSLVERGGWFAADRFVAWLTAKLDAGTINEAARHFSAQTLAEFHHTTSVDLSMVGHVRSSGV
jgi:hypothetical protein